MWLSATSSAESKIATACATWAELVVSGGARWIRFMLLNTTSPASRAALTVPVIAAFMVG